MYSSKIVQHNGQMPTGNGSFSHVITVIHRLWTPQSSDLILCDYYLWGAHSTCQQSPHFPSNKDIY